MRQNFYESTLEYLISQKHILYNDKELYLYAFKVLIRSSINASVFFLMGLILNMLQESILMFFSFFVLRKFAGGLHLKKYSTCFISSVVINFLGLFLIKQLQEQPNYMFVVAVIASCLIITIFAPIKQPNKYISKKEAWIYKFIAMIISGIICLVSCGFVTSSSLEKIAYPLGIGLIISSALVLLGKIYTYKTAR